MKNGIQYESENIDKNIKQKITASLKGIRWI